MEAIDFKELDESVVWTYRKDKLTCAEKLGYKYISEAMYDLHFNKDKTLKEIASVLDYGHALSVKVRFKKFGWQYRIEPHGGNRNYSKLFGSVELLRQEFKDLGKITAIELRDWYRNKAKLYNVHTGTIKVCCAGRTWKNNS